MVEFTPQQRIEHEQFREQALEALVRVLPHVDINVADLERTARDAIADKWTALYDKMADYTRFLLTVRSKDESSPTYEIDRQLMGAISIWVLAEDTRTPEDFSKKLANSPEFREIVDRNFITPLKGSEMTMRRSGERTEFTFSRDVDTPLERTADYAINDMIFRYGNGIDESMDPMAPAKGVGAAVALGSMVWGVIIAGVMAVKGCFFDKKPDKNPVNKKPDAAFVAPEDVGVRDTLKPKVREPDKDKTNLRKLRDGDQPPAPDNNKGTGR